jgi:DNA-binding response OmpR family regulator
MCVDEKEFDTELSEDTYDLFIIDLDLNCERNGVDLIKELRLMNKYKHSPIIVVTASASKKDRESTLLVGANSFMVKPFIMKKLIEEIAKYL